jgi:hypothetical protein
MTAIEEIVHVSEQFAEIIKLIGKGELEARDVSEMLEVLIEGGTPLVLQPSGDRFATPLEQVAKLREWNRMLGHPWTDEEIDRAGADIPAFPTDEPLVPLTLCWTLGSLASSIDAKIDIMRHVYGIDKVVVTRSFNPDEKHTSVVRGGPAFVPHRLWWQLIDLGANRFKAPNQVSPSVAAGVEVFDVFCQHPIYVGQQDGLDTPYLDLPGLTVKVRGMAAPDTPNAAGDAYGNVAVHVHWEGTIYPDHAEPVREP